MLAASYAQVSSQFGVGKREDGRRSGFHREVRRLPKSLLWTKFHQVPQGGIEDNWSSSNVHGWTKVADRHVLRVCMSP
jgi:hypothetical protein